MHDGLDARFRPFPWKTAIVAGLILLVGKGDSLAEDDVSRLREVGISPSSAGVARLEGAEEVGMPQLSSTDQPL